MGVYFYGCVTLDGYLAARDHSLNWLYQTGTAEETGYDDFYRRMDVTLMGRRTFQEIAKLEDPASAIPQPRITSSPTGPWRKRASFPSASRRRRW